MSLLIWVIVGGIAGWIASLITNTDDQMGCITNVVVGMVGSLVGGSLVVLLTSGTLDITTAFTNFNLGSVVVSVIGAVVFILILKALRR